MHNTLIEYSKDPLMLVKYLFVEKVLKNQYAVKKLLGDKTQ